MAIKEELHVFSVTKSHRDKALTQAPIDESHTKPATSKSTFLVSNLAADIAAQMIEENSKCFTLSDESINKNSC